MATKSSRTGHGNCDLMAMRGDDTDKRRRHSLNFIELNGEVVCDISRP
ncbi:MAG: hypothetical protein ACM34A_15210 [Bacillota bacterium]